jgi:hypothetical protein
VSQQLCFRCCLSAGQLLLLQVCWDFYHAAKVGFVALSDATKGLHAPVHDPHTNMGVPLESRPVASLKNLPGPENLGGWSFWDTAVQRPTELKLPQLKDAARYFSLQVGGQLVLQYNARTKGACKDHCV